MGKKTSELKEIWSDLGKSSKLDDLALPDSLKNSPQALKTALIIQRFLKTEAVSRQNLF